jgi:hypothetical protein
VTPAAAATSDEVIEVLARKRRSMTSGMPSLIVDLLAEQVIRVVWNCFTFLPIEPQVSSLSQIVKPILPTCSL